jgi:signal transduction histidine kinase/DNA-binding response OmpR family regulator/ligand-binding sensor domain-containing protein
VPIMKKGISFNVVRWLLLSTILIGLPGQSSGQTIPYKFNYLTVDEGLSHTDANDIAQDHLGYMWVATYFGLDRFDGYVTRQYYNNNDPVNNAFKNRIRCIYPDDSGKIWLGTEFGLQCFDPRSEQYTDYTAPDQKSILHFEKLYKPQGALIYGFVDDRIELYAVNRGTLEKIPLYIPDGVHLTDMTPDGHGTLYLSSDHGLWTVDSSRQFHSVDIRGLTAANLSRICFDEANHLMTASGNTVYIAGIKTADGKDGSRPDMYVQGKFDVPRSTYIRNILHDRIGNYWINTGTELFRFDQRFHMEQAVSRQAGPRSLNTNSLTKAFIDRSQCLWVCTFGGGVNYCDLNEKLFYTFQHEPENLNSLSGNHIRSVLEDGNDLWIGTTANGLNRYDRKTGKFSFYNTYNSAVRIKHDVVESLVLDNDHNLWIGCGAGIQILRPDRKTIWQPPGYANFPTYGVETLAKDCFGNIWFGDHMDHFGVVWKDRNKQYHVRYYGESYFILAEKIKPQLMASSTHGLKRFIIDDEGNILKTYSYNASGTANSLSSNYTYPICRQNDSLYWVGTIGGGLDRLTLDPDDEHYTVRPYADKDGVFKDIESLEIDASGKIWMGGNGLECLDPRTGKVVRYDKTDGLQGNSFKVGSSCKGADGVLYFGGINGLNYFSPEQILPNAIEPRPRLTDILINNQRPAFGESWKSKNGIPESIAYDTSLQLNYLQNNFQISFSSMHFASPVKCRYRYQLIGFDKEWKYTDGKSPIAAYSNLEFKPYRFQLQATNNDGLWANDIAAIEVTITPPWWKSPPAKIAYLLLVLMALAGIYLYQARWYRLKRELEVRAINERKREEMHQQREELYKQQLTFFTNISHEFRTPLTLILGPLEALISDNKNRTLDTSYQLMLRNAKRLIHLISELMNFKKVTDSVIKLHVESLSVHRFCRDIAGEFQTLADSKGIAFTISDHTAEKGGGDAIGHFDVQVLEKILFNLLNNAFKYTNAGGRVSFDIFEDLQNHHSHFANGLSLQNESHRARRYLYFRIADTGIGISGDSLHSIFDRYFRVSSNHLGSGIGLALVKSLTQLHKGDIYVYSERNVGTEIIIGIPWGEENYSNAEKFRSAFRLDTQLEFADSPIPALLPDPETETPAQPIAGRRRLLLVDDNKELRIFLRQAFEKRYYVFEAEDGLSALELAIANVPDLIISDVMMPRMNGVELCKATKERFETSHIPFIILSAKDALDSKIVGMESGADYYFAKPLSIDLLQLTVHNIFEQGEKLKLRFATNYLTDATELVHSEKDKKFFQELMAVIEEHIQDPELDVDFLCERLYISRTKLYQKVQSTSNQSVAEFIRTMRLKKAIHIMTHEDVPMNEVADRIGLQSASNFSRAFKKEYGKSPMQFMQSLKKDSFSQGPL